MDHLVRLVAEKMAAEALLAATKRDADAVRVQYARALLADAFPDHKIAVFAREWDEDSVRLIRILSHSTTIATSGAGSRPDPGAASLDGRQKAAWLQAERAIADIGSDEALYQYLKPGETRHQDWYEFRLVLCPGLGHGPGAGAGDEAPCASDI